MGDLPESQVICNVNGRGPYRTKYQSSLISQDEDEDLWERGNAGVRQLQNDLHRLWMRDEVCGIQPYSKMFQVDVLRMPAKF